MFSRQTLSETFSNNVKIRWIHTWYAMKSRYFILIFLVVVLLVFAVSRRERGRRAAGRQSGSSRVLLHVGEHEHEHEPERVFVVSGELSGDEQVTGQSSLQAADEIEPGKDLVEMNGNKRGSISGELVLSFYDGNDLAAFIALARARGVKVLDTLEEANAVRIWSSDAGLIEELLNEGPTPSGKSANYYIRLPDDPLQTPLAPSSSYVGFGDKSLAWLGVTGGNATWGRGITVAVLDSGVLDHSALAGLAIERISMLNGGAGIDGAEIMAHGTAVVSLIAGTGVGVTGVAPGVSILSIQVLGEEGVGDTFTLARGIVEAVKRGAKIINVSMGSLGDSFILKNAVDYAEANGVIIVASAGNDAIEGVLYPAKYESVVAVSGVDAMGNHLYFANRGPEVDISAPAINISAAGLGDGIETFSGTSAAAPFVSGALAWILSKNPGLSVGQAVQILLENANDIGEPGKDENTGEGALNIKRIQDRDVPGIYDIAVCMPYVSKDPNGDTVVTLFVENRGTEVLSKVEFYAHLGGQDYYLDYYNISVGSVRSRQILLSRSQIKSPEGLSVECGATIDGVIDSIPINNVIKGTLIKSSL